MYSPFNPRNRFVRPRQRIEERGLADIRQPDDAHLEAHDDPLCVSEVLLGGVGGGIKRARSPALALSGKRARAVAPH